MPDGQVRFALIGAGFKGRIDGLALQAALGSYADGMRIAEPEAAPLRSEAREEVPG